MTEPSQDPTPRAPHAPHRGLRSGILTALLLVIAALAYSVLGRPRPAGTPLSGLETGEGVAQRALNLDSTRTRRGLPSFHVTAREVLTYEDGSTQLHDVLLTIFGPGEERTEIAAPLAVSGESGSGWTFRNGVDIRDHGGLRVRMPEIHYRDAPQELSADGEVVFERGPLKGSARGLRYLLVRRTLDFLADVDVSDGTPGAAVRRVRSESANIEQASSMIAFHAYQADGSAGETLSGADLSVVLDKETRRAQKIEGRGGFEAASPGGDREAGLLGKGARTLSGETLTILLERTGVIEGLDAAGGVRMAIGVAGGEARTLRSDRLRIGFDRGRAVSLAAEGEASLAVPPEAGRPGPGANVRAVTLRASLNPADGALHEVRGEGGARASDGLRALSAPTITFDAPGSSWVLEGTAGDEARVEAEGTTINASRVEIRKLEGTLSAKGNVKTLTLLKSREPGEARPSQEPSTLAPVRPAASLFGGGGPVHGMSDSLLLSRGGKFARYRDKVRIWQGGGSIEAASVDISDEGGTLDAKGNVVARVPAKRGDSPEPQIITISASEMHYTREKGEANFSGGVRALASRMRVESDKLLAKGGGESEGQREILAEGNVSFQQGTRTGRGDALTATFGEDRYVLVGRGRLAIIQDQSSQQIVRGAVLTYEGSTDRILVESESGGRTWITLKPHPGEGKKTGDPEPPR